MSVEEVCDECEIQFGISGDERGGCEIFSTIQFVCILENLKLALKDLVGMPVLPVGGDL